MIKLLVLFLVLFFIFCNLADATIGKRHVFNQLQLANFLSAPLNLSTHLGTPIWLQNELYLNDGLILNPTSKHFPNIEKLRLHLPMLMKESQNCVENSKPINKDMYFEGIADDGWKRFYIKWYGPSDKLAKQICPETCKLLDTMPEVHLAMFSILMPGSVIRPHFGPARMSLRYHMGISTPNDDECNIKIGERTYSWRDGKDVMFDDTMIHSVRNNTTKPRIILFLDIERPQEGFFKSITKKQIQYLGPMTTRANNKKENVS